MNRENEKERLRVSEASLRIPVERTLSSPPFQGVAMPTLCPRIHNIEKGYEGIEERERFRDVPSMEKVTLRGYNPFADMYEISKTQKTTQTRVSLTSKVMARTTTFTALVAASAFLISRAL